MAGSENHELLEFLRMSQEILLSQSKRVRSSEFSDRMRSRQAVTEEMKRKIEQEISRLSENLDKTGAELRQAHLEVTRFRHILGPTAPSMKDIEKAALQARAELENEKKLRTKLEVDLAMERSVRVQPISPPPPNPAMMASTSSKLFTPPPVDLSAPLPLPPRSKIVW